MTEINPLHRREDRELCGLEAALLILVGMVVLGIPVLLGIMVFSGCCG